MKRFLLVFLVFFHVAAVSAQERKVTISGNITDVSNGEDLIGVSVYVPDLKVGTTSNEYGFYSLSLPVGTYEIAVSYMGFATEKITVKATENKKLNIKLTPQSSELQEVVVTTDRPNANVSSTETSSTKLTANAIKVIPAMMGEVDLIKALQLLPGVQPVSEGSSNFSVRGGGFDQNLILLDESTVYSASHLLGFFSVFNNDAIKDVKLYKGDIPANFGGRLASVMDVRSRDGNNKKFSGSGGIGTIASRLTLEGPLFTEKATFLVAARRTYADLFLKMSSNDNLKQSQLYFYDFNAKLSWRINDNNRIFLAGYFGRDKFANNMAGMGFGNQTGTLRWNHVFSPKLFSNLSVLVSNYDYSLKSKIMDEFAFDWESHLFDIGAKLDFSYSINPNNTLKFGYNAVHHAIHPGKGGGDDPNSLIESYELPTVYGLEHALYVSHETTLWKKLSIHYGLRFTMFHNLGNNQEAYLLKNHQIIDSISTKRNKIFNTYWNFEPRLGVTYMFNNENSVKASYSRSVQYIQIASNSAAGSPLDLWFPSSKNVKPQISDQFVVGYFRNFLDNMLETSVEIYYKNLQNVVDFKERANLFGNEFIDNELRFGKGYAYGVEFLVRKNKGKVNGWVSYTFSRSKRKIDEVNNNEWFRSPYDKPHNISIVLNYDITKRWSVAASWVYATGTPVTYPTGKYWIGDSYVPIPSARNAYRFPDYHRLDLSATYKLSKPAKRFQHELNVSLYNAYGRKNPWTIYFKQEEDNPNKSYAEMIYLFSFVPSITWNFSF
ncbi:MAG: TonB-dependent receptor [Paludibacter sp.]|jgi:hypothetical protein|nr:TonB-dependent receptor [Paludibacter sp.]